MAEGSSKPARTVTRHAAPDAGVQPAAEPADDAGLVPGGRIVRASWASSALFTLTAVVAAVVFRSPWQQIAFATAFLLFVAGCVVFAWAYLRAIDRSRTHELGIGGLFFAAGTAPRSVARHLNGSFAVQCVVAVGTAAARPFTTLAFGCLVPLLALAFTGLWTARYGTFGPRLGKNGRHG